MAMLQKRKRGGAPAARPAKRRKVVSKVKSAKKRNRRIRKRNKSIEKVVHKVLECKENVGIYTKYYTGEIDASVSAGKDKLVIACQRNGGNTAPYTPFAMSFTPFITKRVWDAASVLYNGKTKSVDTSILTGNFDSYGLKIDMIYASYNLEIVNGTPIPYEMEIFEFENRSNSQTSVLDTLAELNTENNWYQGVPTFSAIGNGVFEIDRCLDFGMLTSMKSRYNVHGFGKKIVAPGGKISWFGKDKKCLDMRKNLFTESAGGSPEIPSFCRGERELAIRYTPVVHMKHTGAEHVASRGTGSNTLPYGFLVTVKEVFKIMEPDSTEDANQGSKRTILVDEPELTLSTDRFINMGPKLEDYDFSV